MKGGACTNERGWPYNPIETAIVDKLLTLAIDDTHFRRDDREGAKLEGEVVRLQRRVIDLTASAQRILRAIGDDDDEIGQEEYQRARQQIKDTKAALQTAQEAFSVAQGKVTPHEHLVRVGDVRKKMESEDAQERYEARTLVKMAFANLIESVTFNERKGFVNVMLVDQQRMFVIDQGKIIEDFDFTKMGAAPGTGKFTTYENATVSIDQDGAHRIVRGDVASVSNDLTTDQQEASAGYARRLKQQKE
jgi:hypothetical protein